MSRNTPDDLDTEQSLRNMICAVYKSAARVEALSATILNSYQLDGSVDDHLADMLTEHISDICTLLAASCRGSEEESTPF